MEANQRGLDDITKLLSLFETMCQIGDFWNGTMQSAAPLAEKNNISCEVLESLVRDLYDVGVTSPYRPERYLVPLLFGLTFGVGILGNGLVVYVVIRGGSGTTVTNLYLLNLAAADILFLVFCVPFTGAYYVTHGWLFGDVMCKVVNYLMVVTIGVTVMTMMAMSIDRYHAVTHPICSKRYRTLPYTGAILAVIWVVTTLSLAPVALISRTMAFPGPGEPQQYCLEKFDSTGLRKIYTLSMFGLFYVIPLGVITVSYYLMAQNLWSSVSPGFLKNRSSKALKSRRRVSKMVLVIVAVFAVSWLPIHCFHLYTEFGDPQNTVFNDVIKVAGHVMSYMNSAMNPVIYGFMSENFRTSCKVACSGVLSACVHSRQGVRNRKPGQVFIVADPEAIPELTSDVRQCGTTALCPLTSLASAGTGEYEVKELEVLRTEDGEETTAL